MQLQAIPTASNLQGLVLFPTISRRKHSKSTSARLVEISTDPGTRGPRFESTLPDFWSIVAATLNPVSYRLGFASDPPSAFPTIRFFV